MTVTAAGARGGRGANVRLNLSNFDESVFLSQCNTNCIDSHSLAFSLDTAGDSCEPHLRPTEVNLSEEGANLGEAC